MIGAIATEKKIQAKKVNKVPFSPLHSIAKDAKQALAASMKTIDSVNTRIVFISFVIIHHTREIESIEDRLEVYKFPDAYR